MSASRDATIRQCAVLVGGLGTRLGALAAETPKPMLEVGGKPFLFWLLRELSRFGVEEALLLTGHLSERVAAGVRGIAEMLPRRMAIEILEEPARAGTGGALFYARDRLHDRFLVCNGDSLLDANLADLLAAGQRDPPEVLGRLLLRRMADTSRCGVARTDGDRITAFHESGATVGPRLINAGITLLDRRVLDEVTGVCSLEADILPRLAAHGALRGTPTDGWFIDIGVPDDLARARRDLAPRMCRPAVFLDRDGTINVDHGWVGARDRFEWIDGAREAIRMATEAGRHVFIVTNQSGVARGHYDEAAVAALHAWLADEVRRAGGTIDDLRYCPDHPEALLPAYRRLTDWRKPGAGMILDLMRAWDVDPAHSFMVGDQPSDLAAAETAGIAGHRFTGGNLAHFIAPLLAGPPT